MTDERLSVQMIILSGSIIAVVLAVFELLMPTLPHAIDFKNPLTSSAKDPTFNLILYTVSSGLHILVSLFFSYQLWQGIRRMSPMPRFRIKTRIIIISTLFYGSLLICASYLKLKIVTYSHHRTLEILEPTLWGGFMKMTIPFTSISWFSLYPIFLILCGILFGVVACIWSAVKANDIAHNQLEKKDFDSDAIWSEISMFSIVVASVFLTSTIATTFYLNIGRNLTESDAYGRFYSSSSDALSILWAACFSAIMIVIVLYPTRSMNEKARLTHKKSRVMGDDLDRFKFVYGALSTERILKMLAILFTPIYVAAVRAAIT